MTDFSEVQNKAQDIRIDIIEMVHAAGSGHPGGSLSCADILATLYFDNILTYDAGNPAFEDRDRFILCKGHAAPALYATLAEAGYFKKEELNTLRKLGSHLQGHPDMHKCPGVEVSTGSLGQGLSIACGMAKGLKLQDKDTCVFALLGDGECQEGQVWEAAMFANHFHLDNLVAIIDNNGLQIDGKVDDVMTLGDLSAKFSAFGWHVETCDGHNYSDLHEHLAHLKVLHTNQPKCLICKTVKGKGVSFMENEAGWHGKAPNDEQYMQAINELKAE